MSETNKVQRWDLVEIGPDFHKRTEMDHDDDNGSWVTYEDYAALQQKLDAVLAENANLVSEVVNVREQAEDVYAAGYRQGHLNTSDGIAYAPGAEDEFYHSALEVMVEVETPSTEAILNDVRAEGVEMLTSKLQQLIDEGVFDAKEIGVAAGAVYEGAQIANQLRAGKDGEL